MGKKVLIVDDDYGSAQLLQLLLEMDGFEARICTSVADVFSQATEPVDAFIIDQHLSGGQNGLDLLHAIRNGQAQIPAGTPVIVISGDLRMESKAYQAGADSFLMKPFSPHELSRQIKTLTAGHRT
jgi:DNA-binding response OmpR family regulator